MKIILAVVVLSVVICACTPKVRRPHPFAGLQNGGPRPMNPGQK